MALQRTYRGFSTQGAERTREWASNDVELVKRDLMNHFMTSVGERVMRPEYGCKIWDYLHEPLTPVLREQIIEEAIRICKSDPRCEVSNVFLFDFDNGLRIELTLNFLGFAVMETFTVSFERREDERFAGKLEF